MEIIISIIGRGEAYVTRRFAGDDISPVVGSSSFMVRRSAEGGGWQGERLVAVSPVEGKGGFQIGGVLNPAGSDIKKIPVATLVSGNFTGMGIYSVTFEDREVPTTFNVQSPNWGSWEKTRRKL